MIYVLLNLKHPLFHNEEMSSAAELFSKVKIYCEMVLSNVA